VPHFTCYFSKSWCVAERVWFRCLCGRIYKKVSGIWNVLTKFELFVSYSDNVHANLQVS